MSRSTTAVAVVALAWLSTACGDDSAGSSSATSSAPCFDDLTARVEAVRASVDALELTTGPDGARGAEGAAGPAGQDADVAAYEALAADLDDLETELDVVESSLEAAETQVAALAPRSQELLNAMSMLALAP